MKKFNFLLLMLITLSSCLAQEHAYTVFSGNVKNTNEKTIRILKIDNSFAKEVAIDALGNFTDTLYVDTPSSFYYQIGKSYTTVFLKNGYNLNVSINADDFFKSIKYTGKGSDVNNFHVARGTLKGKLVGDAKTFFIVPVDTFLNKIDNNKVAFLALLEKSNLNEKDKELQRKIIENDYLLTRYNYDKFYHYHTGEHAKLPSNYYNPIKEMDLTNEALFDNDKSYRTLLIEHWRITSKEAMDKDPNLTMLAFVKEQIKDIKNTRIKDHIASMLIREMNKNNKNIEQDYLDILTIFTDEKLKEKLTTRYKSVNETKPEMASPDFNYENHSGGTTALKDLKGNILYIEIWATWCGPCIKEMPALKQLITDFKDDNIKFVSISIDSKNDYEKWKAMVPNKNVGGIQLFADKGLESDFMKAFSVGLIPRSILLDENGTIINPKAPRPSGATTKQYLQSLLNKKQHKTIENN